MSNHLIVLSCQQGSVKKGGRVGIRQTQMWMIVVGIVMLYAANGYVQEIQKLGDFSSGSLEKWKSKSFEGKTVYDLTVLEGVTMLRAVSNGTASGMTLEKNIDLTKTPYLNWSWRVDHILSSREETQKAGDDYPARIYVVVSGGFAFWRTKALNYVWASYMPANTTWPNAFTSNAQMLALRSGSVDAGKIVTEKRNVREDLKRYMDLDADQIDAVAIMTDTDNGGGNAVAYYGDISFSAQ